MSEHDTATRSFQEEDTDLRAEELKMEEGSRCLSGRLDGRRHSLEAP